MRVIFPKVSVEEWRKFFDDSLIDLAQSDENEEEVFRVGLRIERLYIMVSRQRKMAWSLSVKMEAVFLCQRKLISSYRECEPCSLFSF